MGKPVVDLSGKREVFWDDFMIEPEKTEAELRLHKPVKKEMVMHLDMPWEGDGCDYYNIMNDDGLYRMYYLGWYMINPGRRSIRVVILKFVTQKAGTAFIGLARIWGL